MAEQSIHEESKIPSSEQLDLPIRVTTPMGWIALLAAGSLVVIVILWSVYGRISMRVSGQGVLIRSGGVFEVVATSSGQLSEIYVDLEETIERGQVIARVSQPEIMEKIRNTRAGLQELKAEREKIKEFAEADIKANEQSLNNKRSELNTAIRFATERIKWLNERLTNQEVLLDRGLITRQTYINTQQEINAGRQELESSRNLLHKLSADQFEFEEQKNREIRNSSYAISQKERDLVELESLYEDSSKVVSPYTGRILEIDAAEGKVIAPGEPVLSVEMVGEVIQNLEAAIYIPSGKGMRVRPGMRAHISPSTVKQEEHGFMLGIVTYVSEFPASRKGMLRVLQNDSLVETLADQGAPVQIFADLIPDPETVSGYKWSSSKGPPSKIQSGTMCSVTVVVSEKPPISLVIPILGKLLGSE